jgi:SAM-dependent methyltransferase
LELFRIFKHKNIEHRFTVIFEKNHWRNPESISGDGSTLAFTENLRRALPEVLKIYSIKSILDAPCGDFNWMNVFLKDNSLKYIGVDIVEPIVNYNKVNYSKLNVDFLKLDITKDALPMADMMLCRDCLFHLSYRDTRAVLINYINSNIPYLLTTTHINNDNFSNRDISSGDFRLIDLFSAPYNFSEDVLFRIDDWVHPHRRREMCLWSRQQIVDAVLTLPSKEPIIFN